jgi:hypothetical protein
MLKRFLTFGDVSLLSRREPHETMTPQEYRVRFIAHLTAKGIAPNVAQSEYQLWAESFSYDAENLEHPERDAREQISY